MDMVKVKKALEVFSALSADEKQAFFVIVATLNEMTAGKSDSKPAEEKVVRGPDPRGRYKCRYCDKVLPTKRGRGIHEKMHDRKTAPGEGVTP